MNHFESIVVIILSAMGFKYMDKIMIEIKNEKKLKDTYALYLYYLIIAACSLYGFYFGLSSVFAH